MHQKYKVCILTAGKGSRLNERTKCFNKSLLRVGNKAAVSHTIDAFPEDVEFVIGLGYLGDIVKQYLLITYPQRKFEFVEIDKYSQPGSGPGYALLKCKKYLQCPFYYVSCDSIINWDTLLKNDFDWSAYDCVNQIEAYKYCTIEINDSKIQKILDKQRNGTCNAYVGVSFIKNYKELWTFLDEEPETSDKEIQVATSILKMNNMVPVKCVWHDIGSEEGLKNARDHFKGLENLDKLEEEIYIFDKFVVKYFYHENMIKDRLERYNRLFGLVPDILSNSRNFYKYEYIKGEDLSEYENAHLIVDDLLTLSKNKLWKKVELGDIAQENFLKSCYDFYYNKTLKRLEKISKEKPYIFENVENDKEEYINELLVPKIKDVFDKIDWDYICNGIPTNFHGDFVFSNILYTKENNFKFIDWRQDFGGLIDCGDIFYDFAKLNAECLMPRSSVKSGMFYVKKNHLDIKTFIEIPVQIEKCKDCFEKFISLERYDINKINILSALVFLNMSPLHEHPLDEWLYYYGKYHLYKTLLKGRLNV